MDTLSLQTSATLQTCPAHGAKTVCGLRSVQEDAFSVQTNFFVFATPSCSPVDDVLNKLPARIATQIGEQLEQTSGSPLNSAPLSPSLASAASRSLCTDTDQSVGGSYSSSSSASSSDSGCDTLHFFAVYDGHGGTEAAQHCANRLHHHLSVALAGVAPGQTLHTAPPLCLATSDPDGGVLQCQAEFTLCKHDYVETDPASLTAEQLCMDTASTDTSSFSFQPTGLATHQELAPPKSSDGPSVTQLLEDALRDAFLRTDAEFAADGSSAMVGSTAVVALVGGKKMWIANCGDSRAVLCRGSKAIQVTDDHKPEREDEALRVEKAGGQVLYWNGHRVMGVLAMSRAIGDHGLRPFVIPEPEITMLSRAEEDDFLLLASDGLWDVLANQEAISLAMRCMNRAWEKGATRKAAARIAASVLTKAAIDRGSKDNITVVIIDLKTPQPMSSNHEPSSTCAPSRPQQQQGQQGQQQQQGLHSQDTLVGPLTCCALGLRSVGGPAAALLHTFASSQGATAAASSATVSSGREGPAPVAGMDVASALRQAQSRGEDAEGQQQQPPTPQVSNSLQQSSAGGGDGNADVSHTLPPLQHLHLAAPGSHQAAP